ncbi:MAG: DUF2442 domain-containing protein [Chitinophagaceae bacterium]|nr:DUF2442 domain-containing protein [Chitinophagaceae bacterium]
MNPRAKNVEYENPYKLIITFTNGEVKLFDLQPYLAYPVYEPLKNELLCSNAAVKYGTIVWNDEIDIDPDRLYLESKTLNYSS